MAGNRQHTIPQFLQKGFASTEAGTNARIWMYRKGQSGRQVGIKDAAVERFFYGDPTEPDLDQAITKLEHEYIPLLNHLKTRDDGEAVDSDLIPEMVAHLCVRTRHIRNSTARLFEEITQSVVQELSCDQVMARIVANALRRPGANRDGFQAAAFDAGGNELLGAVQSRKGRAIVEAHLRDDPEFNGEMKRRFNELIAGIGEKVHEAVKRGCNDAMRKNVRVPKRAESYRDLRWHVLESDIPLLLGDTVIVLETSGARRFKPLDGRGDHIHRLYLPISSSRVLIGSYCRDCPRIMAQVLNQLIVRCSDEFFLSSVPLEIEDPLIAEIGIWSGLLTDTEKQKIIRKVVQSTGLLRG
jgi:hypothetical protein